MLHPRRCSEHRVFEALMSARILENQKIYIYTKTTRSTREQSMKDSVSVDQTQVAATKSDSEPEKKGGGQPQFLPKLLNRSIMIRMMDGRPIKGVLEAFNAYELLLDLGQGKKLIIFKGAISSIDYEDKPPKEKKEIKRW
jgi:host factor-I protein